LPNALAGCPAHCLGLHGRAARAPGDADVGSIVTTAFNMSFDGHGSRVSARSFVGERHLAPALAIGA
jgi:hypothetical protein